MVAIELDWLVKQILVCYDHFYVSWRVSGFLLGLVHVGNLAKVEASAQSSNSGTWGTRRGQSVVPGSATKVGCDPGLGVAVVNRDAHWGELQCQRATVSPGASIFCKLQSCASNSTSIAMS
ncbi:hypothetical protein O6H91_Y096400 [Diphasiastrum complanatum]|nr:hypothetical protein O6H91_Y096400 [Diphasiastrum complanatum]